MSKIRQSAKGEDCAIRYPGVCNHNPETVVWSHVNGIRYGKGFAKKSLDELGAYACSRCHAVYDGQAPRPEGMTQEQAELWWWQGHGESLVKLKQKGLI